MTTGNVADDGVVRNEASTGVKRRKANDLMWDFVQEVERSPIGAKVPAFWLKQKQGRLVYATQPAQAAIVAAARDGMLFCKGKPGSMSFYTASESSIGNPLYRINGLFRIFVTMLLLWLLVITPLAGMDSSRADIVISVLAVAMIAAYGLKAFSYASLRPLLAYIPGAGSGTGITTKTGLYWIGVSTSVGLLIAMFLRSGDHNADLGWGEVFGGLVPAAVGMAGHWLDVLITDIPSMLEWELMLQISVLLMPVTLFVPAWMIGALLSRGADGEAQEKLQAAGMSQRFSTDSGAMRLLNHQRGAPFLGHLFLLFWVGQGIVWIDQSLLGI